MQYKETMPLHVTVYKEQYEFLSEMVDARCSNFSQVIREIIEAFRRQLKSTEERYNKGNAK